MDRSLIIDTEKEKDFRKVVVICLSKVLSVYKQYKRGDEDTKSFNGNYKKEVI